MRPAVLSAAFAAFVVALIAADFPKPADLPAQAELPDPLVMFNGEHVKTKDDWFKKRRPGTERAVPALHVRHRAAGAGEDRRQDRARRQKLLRRQGDAERNHHPLRPRRDAADPSAARHSQQAHQAGPGVRRHEFQRQSSAAQRSEDRACRRCGFRGKGQSRRRSSDRGKDIDVWALQQTIDRGYAVATFYCGDVDPDRKDKREGMQPHYPNKYDWGTIAAWAWGISRAVDYLVTDKDLDKIEDRRGRPFAARQDRPGGRRRSTTASPWRFRFRPAAAARRRAAAKSASRSSASTPAFRTGSTPTSRSSIDHPDKLPFDQHCLIALCAPRPVLLANAEEDTWANPERAVRGAESGRSGVSPARRRRPGRQGDAAESTS